MLLWLIIHRDTIFHIKMLRHNSLKWTCPLDHSEAKMFLSLGYFWVKNPFHIEIIEIHNSYWVYPHLAHTCSRPILVVGKCTISEIIIFYRCLIKCNRKPVSIKKKEKCIEVWKEKITTCRLM